MWHIGNWILDFDWILLLITLTVDGYATLAQYISLEYPQPGVLVRLQPSRKRVSFLLPALALALISSISLFSVHLFNLLQLPPTSSCLSTTPPCLSSASLLNSDVCVVCRERWVRLINWQHPCSKFCEFKAMIHSCEADLHSLRSHHLACLVGGALQILLVSAGLLLLAHLWAKIPGNREWEVFWIILISWCALRGRPQIFLLVNVIYLSEGGKQFKSVKSKRWWKLEGKSIWKLWAHWPSDVNARPSTFHTWVSFSKSLYASCFILQSHDIMILQNHDIWQIKDANLWNSISPYTWMCWVIDNNYLIIKLSNNQIIEL